MWRRATNVTTSSHMLRQRFTEIRFNMPITKAYFQTVRSLSGKPPSSYPDHDSLSECVNTFSAYFDDRITEIRIKLHGANNQCHTALRETRRFLTQIVTFDATRVSKIELLIAKTSKTCHLDPMPSNHVKDNIISLASVITNITNASLSERPGQCCSRTTWCCAILIDR